MLLTSPAILLPPEKPAILRAAPPRIIKPGDPRFLVPAGFLPFPMGMIGSGAAGSAAHSNLTFRNTNNTTGVSQSSVTYASQTIGTAASDRYVIVAVYTDQSSGTISSVTVGGVSATAAHSSFVTALGVVGIYAALVPTGTTADIVINTSITASGFHAAHWTVNMASGTAYDTATNTQASGANAVSGLDIPANGFAVGFAVIDDGTSTYTINQSFTERSDGAVVTKSGGVADREPGAGGFSGTVTWTWSVTTESSRAVMASWQ